MKYLTKIWYMLRDSHHFFYQGFKKNLLKEHFKAFVSNGAIHLNKFHQYLLETNVDHQEMFNAVHKRTKGLHALLPNSQNFSYSLLIDLNDSSPKQLQSCLTSACMQTAPNFEILIGFKTPMPEDISKIIQALQVKHPDLIKLFDLSKSHEEPVYNQLVQKSQGIFLLILDQEDWLRPDLLYRYEQLLRTHPDPEKTVINCAEKQISPNDQFIPSFPLKKNKPDFPYIFKSPFDLRGLLIPKALWDQTGGIRNEFTGAEGEDLLLRLDLADSHFETIPLSLYYRREKPKKYHKEMHLNIFIKALEDYAKNKGLDWTFDQGYLSNSVRAIPKTHNHKIQIVIPFKEQKELTLRCIDSILKQKGVSFQITAVDNASNDLSIGYIIREHGGEVLRVDEPFNYSRLNNLAVNDSKAAKDCDLVLFLNNDVELDENALLEMVRWIDQPSIGMVGARLHYPNGQLQHGGVTLNEHFLKEQLCWEHIEKFKSFEEMKETKVHAIVEAVTAACALVKKEDYLKVGGFDEIWYPIGFSDTNLAMKLKKIGLKCFYTPYAFGIHHESISRKISLEDVESSRWLHELILK
jgi:GT2 family glycosyltransferase